MSLHIEVSVDADVIPTHPLRAPIRGSKPNVTDTWSGPSKRGAAMKQEPEQEPLEFHE